MLKFLRAVFSFERLLGYAMLAGFLFLYYADPYPVQFLRLKVFDYYQQQKPREIPPPQGKPVTIIDLDENSLSEIGQWPWPRDVIARMVQNLMQMGAGLVAFDVTFPEPDRMNPAGIADDIKGLDEETKNKLRAIPSNDQIFAGVIKKSRVVLGQTGYWEKREADEKAPPPIKKSIALRGTKGAPNPGLWLNTFPSLVRNVPVIEKYASGHGIFTILPERDGIIRRVSTLFKFEKNILPALSVEMLRIAFNRKTIQLKYNAAGISEIGIASRRQFPPNGLKIPTDSRGRVWPYFSKSDKAKYVSAKDVLNGTADPALIKGKLTIVGTSAAGLLDIRATPIDPIIPGDDYRNLGRRSALLPLASRANVFPMTRLTLAAFLLLLLSPTAHADITGPARIIDGDTLHINKTKIRLHGIDAPEMKQTCKTAKGEEQLCGVLAKQALERLVHGQDVTCKGDQRDRYKRLIAVCYIGSLNINEQMVTIGWALAYRKYSKDYVGAENMAKAPQCIGLPPTGSGNHHPDGPGTGHALTFMLDHSMGADH